MLIRQFLASAFGLLAFAIPTFGAEPQKIRIFDDFGTNSLKDYQIEGDVTWQKGQVTLGKGAKLTRKIALGHTAEVRALIRFPAGKETQEARLRFQHDKVSADIALLRENRKVMLVNLRTPTERIQLPAAGKDGGETLAELQWAVCFAIRYGMVRAKAWRADTVEPQDWQAARYSDDYGQPAAISFVSEKTNDLVLNSLAVIGSLPEEPLTPEQRRKAQEAQQLDDEAFKLYQGGEFEKALNKMNAALRLQEDVLGSNHLSTTEVLMGLSALNNALGDYPKARTYLGRALASRTEILGPDHPGTASCLNSMGTLTDLMGDPAAARPFFERALEIRKKVLGPTDPLTAESLQNYGYILRQTGQFQSARSYYEQSLDITKKVRGEDHPETIRCLNNLAILLGLMGDYGSAKRYQEHKL